jgi:hypothetical protein
MEQCNDRVIRVTFETWQEANAEDASIGVACIGMQSTKVYFEGVTSNQA